MKKFGKILFCIVAVYFIFLIGFQLNQQITAIKAKQVTMKLLDQTIEGNYDKAFKHIYYYNGPYDYSPTIEFEDAKEIWTARNRTMKGEGINLSSYSSLRTNYNDGWVYGSADLVFNEQGKETKYHTIFNYHIGKDGIKISTLQSFDADGSNEVEWEKNLSGYISK